MFKKGDEIQKVNGEVFSGGRALKRRPSVVCHVNMRWWINGMLMLIIYTGKI